MAGELGLIEKHFDRPVIDRRQVDVERNWARLLPAAEGR
jgi:hypothetical protein